MSHLLPCTELRLVDGVDATAPLLLARAWHPSLSWVRALLERRPIPAPPQGADSAGSSSDTR